MVKGFLIVSGVYKKHWFYADDQSKALALAKSCGWFEPKIKESRWFQHVNQHEALGIL